MAVASALLLGSCAFGGGTEEARWWIDRDTTIEPSTISFDVRVGYLHACVDDQLEADGIEGYSVTYDEEAVTVSITVRVPNGIAPRECPPLVGGEPVMTVVLDEPLGDRTLTVGRGAFPPAEAIVYNY